MSAEASKFHAGQLVQHRRFGYRGVIVSVDESFQGSDEWYESATRSRPSKDQPWYHLLVHGSSHETYVAERNLELDDSQSPVEHPLVDVFFDQLVDGEYVRNRILN